MYSLLPTNLKEFKQKNGLAETILQTGPGGAFFKNKLFVIKLTLIAAPFKDLGYSVITKKSRRGQSRQHTTDSCTSQIID